MKRPNTFVILLTVCILTQVPWAKPEYFPPDGFLPEWKGGPIEKYLSRDQLFAYMDGGAEIYLDYRFKKLEVKEYNGPQGATLTLEIYEFSAPEDAFGIFSQDTSGEFKDVGQGGRASKTLTRFWNGSTYVRAFTWQSRPDLEGIPLIFIQAMAPKILPGDLPLWLNNLKTNDLSPMFIRTAETLNRLANTTLPADIAIASNFGAAWLSPPMTDLAGCVILCYPNDSTANSTFKALWGEIATMAQGSARSETRGIASISGSSFQGIQQVGATVVWVPGADDELLCAGTLDRVAEALIKPGD